MSLVKALCVCLTVVSAAQSQPTDPKQVGIFDKMVNSVKSFFGSKPEVKKDQMDDLRPSINTADESRSSSIDSQSMSMHQPWSTSADTSSVSDGYWKGAPKASNSGATITSPGDTPNDVGGPPVFAQSPNGSDLNQDITKDPSQIPNEVTHPQSQSEPDVAIGSTSDDHNMPIQSSVGNEAGNGFVPPASYPNDLDENKITSANEDPLTSHIAPYSTQQDNNPAASQGSGPGGGIFRESSASQRPESESQSRIYNSDNGATIDSVQPASSDLPQGTQLQVEPPTVPNGNNLGPGGGVFGASPAPQYPDSALYGNDLGPGGGIFKVPTAPQSGASSSDNGAIVESVQPTSSYVSQTPMDQSTQSQGWLPEPYGGNGMSQSGGESSGKMPVLDESM